MVAPQPVSARTLWTDQYAEALAAYQAHDYAKARAGFQSLADFGSPAAEAMLGHIYLNGQGTAKRPGVAAVWYFRSAQKGYGNAQLALGSMLASGIGLREDIPHAYFWFEIASQRGEPKVAALARKFQADLQPKLTAAQIANAVAKARTWRPSAATPR
jgi:TPR repeat protein